MTGSTQLITKKDIESVLATVMDPEIPVLSVLDLGIITRIEISADFILVGMTPTFSGCPALHVIQKNIQEAVEGLDAGPVEVAIDRHIAWDSNRLTEDARRKLRDFGLADPGIHQGDVELSDLEDVTCPHCQSTVTSMRSLFGSALCRSMHICHACGQAFERFKPVA